VRYTSPKTSKLLSSIKDIGREKIFTETKGEAKALAKENSQQIYQSLLCQFHYAKVDFFYINQNCSVH